MDNKDTGTPVSIKPNSNESVKPKKARANTEMEISPSDNEIEIDEVWTLNQANAKILNLQLKNEQYEKSIQKLTEDMNKLTERISKLEGRRCECKCVDGNSLDDRSNNKLCFKTAVIKSIKGKNDEPKPVQPAGEINMVNSVMVEQRERELKSMNLIVYGIEVSKKSDGKDRKQEDTEKVEEIFSALKADKRSILNIIRFKNKSNDPGKTPPILVKLENSQKRDEILKAARGLHKLNKKFEKIYINADLTEAERVFEKQLREERDTLNDSERAKSSTFKWIIRDNKIIRIKPLTDGEKQNYPRNQPTRRGGFNGSSTRY